MENGPALEALGITKSFYGNKVLDKVNFTVKKGEVHALLGHNGAGKSTLIKILLGVYQFDEGTIKVKGSAVEISNPQLARENGLSVVHQELNLFPDLSVAENMFLTREFTKGTSKNIISASSWLQTIDKKRMLAECEKHLKRVGVFVDPRELIRNLSMGQRQLVEIAKGLSENANILVLDEPTSSLSVHESKILFKIIRQLALEGVSIIFISHRMEEIFDVCDQITVLRNGRLIDSIAVSDTNTEQVIELMMGKNVENLYAENLYAENLNLRRREKETVLKIENLTSDGAFEDVNLEVNRGEILGLAGLVGAGRTEVLEAIFGIRKITEGKILYLGKNIKFKEPSQAVKNSIGFVTEDRKDQGLFLKMDVGKNISMVILDKLKKLGSIDFKKEKEAIDFNIERLKIKTTGAAQPITELSGGNQQKVVIAKWLARGIDLLLLDEPTRGVDVNSKSEIYRLIKEFAAAGGTVIMVSSELSEVLGVSDRIITFNKGKVTGEILPKDATENKIMGMIV
ncbi:sugar ABC transporter ATP-binding protein [Aneurinibacillus sp. REN35]|uniref:sugar ABC transporter ATP-binding protein n=1 Tax=Aneurinibacillus sp. REN35 TaxID=3237286 RepID=UPI00352877E3